MRKGLTILAIAAAHLLLTRIIMVITMNTVTAHAFDGQLSPASKLLVSATRVLSFPIISLSLYPRQWYPGNLIYIPFILNSLLWAAAVYSIVVLVKKSRPSGE